MEPSEPTGVGGCFSNEGSKTKMRPHYTPAAASARMFLNSLSLPQRDATRSYFAAFAASAFNRDPLLPVRERLSPDVAAILHAVERYLLHARIRATDGLGK